MQVHSGLTHSATIDVLTKYVATDKTPVVMVCHAIAHGHYATKRVVIVYDAASEQFVVIRKS